MRKRTTSIALERAPIAIHCRRSANQMFDKCPIRFFSPSERWRTLATFLSVASTRESACSISAPNSSSILRRGIFRTIAKSLKCDVWVSSCELLTQLVRQVRWQCGGSCPWCCPCCPPSSPSPRPASSSPPAAAPCSRWSPPWEKWFLTVLPWLSSAKLT